MFYVFIALICAAVFGLCYLVDRLLSHGRSKAAPERTVRQPRRAFVIGIVMLVYLPWNLFLTARKQAITNEAFQKPLHYTFAEDGVYVSQGETVQMQAWEDMYKAISTSVSIVLYTSRVNASVFPRKDLGDDTATVIELISTHMPPKKVRIRR